jgi:hypothetical protein
MSKPLNVVEATALLKTAEKELKRCTDGGEKVTPGNHDFDVTIHLDGSLSRGTDTTQSPNFYMDKFLKPLLLRYAETLNKEYDAEVKKNPKSRKDVKPGTAWLETMMNVNGALGAIIQLGAEKVLETSDATLIALYNKCEEEAKEKFRAVTPKAARAGNTVVVANLERSGPTKVVAAKRKP